MGSMIPSWRLPIGHFPLYPIPCMILNPFPYCYVGTTTSRATTLIYSSSLYIQLRMSLSFDSLASVPIWINLPSNFLIGCVAWCLYLEGCPWYFGKVGNFDRHRGSKEYSPMPWSFIFIFFSKSMNNDLSFSWLLDDKEAWASLLCGTITFWVVPIALQY